MGEGDEDDEDDFDEGGEAYGDFDMLEGAEAEGAEENEEGYRDGSVMEHASKIEGRLMLVHGCLDENVHFRHTARLVTALIHARKTYQLLAFPDERHLPRGHADRVYMEERIEAFLTAL